MTTMVQPPDPHLTGLLQTCEDTEPSFTTPAPVPATRRPTPVPPMSLAPRGPQVYTMAQDGPARAWPWLMLY